MLEIAEREAEEEAVESSLQSSQVAFLRALISRSRLQEGSSGAKGAPSSASNARRWGTSRQTVRTSEVLPLVRRRLHLKVPVIGQKSQ